MPQPTRGTGIGRGRRLRDAMLWTATGEMSAAPGTRVYGMGTVVHSTRQGWGGGWDGMGWRMGWADVQVLSRSTYPSYQSCSWRRLRKPPLRFDKNINLKHGAKPALMFPISRSVGWMAHVAATQRRPQPSEAVLRRSRRLRRPSREAHKDGYVPWRWVSAALNLV